MPQSGAMIEIKDIVDGGSLERWLTDWPASQGLDDEASQKIAVTIAHRAAMRVMPVWWHWTLSQEARKRDLTALPVLRCLQISGVAARVPTSEISAAVRAFHVASSPPVASAFAAVASASAAASAVRASSSAVAFAADSAVAADSAADFAAWVSIRADCVVLSEEEDIFSTSLWGDEENLIARLWSEVKTQALEPEWAFWIKWYEDALAGREQNWDMLEEIALIDSEVWDAGAVAVAAEIERIRQKYEPQKPAKPSAVVIQNAVALNLSAIPPQLDALIKTIDVEIERLRGRNPKDDLEKRDLDQLRGTFETMRGAVFGLSKFLPSQGSPEIEVAEELGGLLQLYQNEFRNWPRENAADLVDSSCRVALIGLTAGVLTTFGLPALACTAVAGIAFGGKKLVGIGKALKDAAPTSG